jgi:hypothetical protein
MTKISAESRRQRKVERTKIWRSTNRAKLRAYNKQYKKDHATEIKAHVNLPQTKKARLRRAVLRAYRMTQAEYDAMLVEQGNGCAVCGRVEGDGYSQRLQVDHDHITGEVRGLLCGPCNKALGLMRDSQENVQRAADYLKKFNSIKKCRLVGVCP